MFGIFFIPSVNESSWIDTNYSYGLIIIFILELILIFIYFKYLRGYAKVFLNNNFINYISSTKIYKATKEVNVIPSMNLKVQAFHNHIIVRVFRVIGGISFLILGLSYYDYYTLPYYLHTLLFVVVMIHLTYSVIISVHSVYYLIKALIRGDYIYRNSPINLGYSFYKA